MNLKYLSSFFLFADNENLEKTNRFAKVRPLFEAVKKQCVAYYKLEQHLSVDKSMVPYLGKHSAKQYIHGNQLSLAISCGYWQSPWDTAFNSVHMLVKTYNWMYTEALDWE